MYTCAILNVHIVKASSVTTELRKFSLKCSKYINTKEVNSIGEEKLGQKKTETQQVWEKSPHFRYKYYASYQQLFVSGGWTLKQFLGFDEQSLRENLSLS